MQKETLKENRGGKRIGAGRPCRNKEKGKMHTHGITMHDDTWEEIVKEASKLDLSASQYLVMTHREYIKK